jgi:hypothetical protein
MILSHLMPDARNDLVSEVLCVPDIPQTVDSVQHNVCIAMEAERTGGGSCWLARICFLFSWNIETPSSYLLVCFWELLSQHWRSGLHLWSSCQDSRKFSPLQCRSRWEVNSIQCSTEAYEKWVQFNAEQMRSDWVQSMLVSYEPFSVWLVAAVH